MSSIQVKGVPKHVNRAGDFTRIKVGVSGSFFFSFQTVCM